MKSRSDILLHIADVSHPALEDQIKVVKQTLSEIGAGDKPLITVFNKSDLLPEPAGQKTRGPFRRSGAWMRGKTSRLSISARKKPEPTS